MMVCPLAMDADGWIHEFNKKIITQEYKLPGHLP